jgi:hypothetical protein
MPFDELLAGLHLLAHPRAEEAVRHRRVVDLTLL